MKRVAFLVAHLSGTGHLTRILAIAEAVRDAGGEALVISGGRPLPHIPESAAIAQLPPVAVSGLDFSRLLTAEGAPVDAALMAARGTAIRTTLDGFKPDVLVTELFPFGRRVLADEFLMAVDHAAALGARIAASVRDIPEPPRKPARIAEAAQRLRARYSVVLAHGDPARAPFSLGWPGADEIADLLRFTGYVATPLPAPLGAPEEVVAAVGGGATGREDRKSVV